MGWLLTYREELQVLAAVITALGIPVAIVGIFVTRSHERWRRSAIVYKEITRDYADLIRTCLLHPDLGVLDEAAMYETLGVRPDDQDIATHRRKWLLYNLAITDIEAAFLSLRDGPARLRRKQWDGWRDWALDFLEQPEFRKVWRAVGPSFDSDFYAEMTNLMLQRDRFSTSGSGTVADAGPGPTVTEDIGGTPEESTLTD
jgi:hypothetical protein